MQNNPLIQLVYISKATILYSQEELLSLLTKARSKNSALNITGMLLYKDRSFLQLLEGEKAQVADVFENIKCDARHHRINVLIDFEKTNKRLFPDWSMGFQKLDDNDISNVEGFSAFMNKRYQDNVDSDIAGNAYKLLKYFRSRA